MEMTAMNKDDLWKVSLNSAVQGGWCMDKIICQIGAY